MSLSHPQEHPVSDLDTLVAPPPTLTLRPYQHQALDAIMAATLRGVRRQVVTLPTGAGKTVIFANDTLLEVLHGADLLSAAGRAHVLEAVKHVGEAWALRTNAANGP
jgi:hypothetical protein